MADIIQFGTWESVSIPYFDMIWNAVLNSSSVNEIVLKAGDYMQSFVPNSS